MNVNERLLLSIDSIPFSVGANHIKLFKGNSPKTLELINDAKTAAQSLEGITQRRHRVKSELLLEALLDYSTSPAMRKPNGTVRALSSWPATVRCLT